MCFCLCFRASLPCPRSYSDLIANVAFVMSVPCIAFVILFTALPILFWILLSYCGCCDNFAHVFWIITHYMVAYPINMFEKNLIHLISVVLNPIAFCRNYKNNQKVINFIRQTSDSRNTKYRGEKYGCLYIHRYLCICSTDFDGSIFVSSSSAGD